MTSHLMRSVDVGGVPFCVTTLHEAVDWTIRRAARRSSPGLAIRLANAYSVVMAQRSAAYGDLLQGSGVNFPDGTPVAWTMRRVGAAQASRVRGPSFFVDALDRGRAADLRHYFFGTDASVLAKLLETVELDFPGIIVAGASAPDFQEDPALLAAQLPRWVDRDTVDIVWVGLGSPKQDFVAHAIAAERGLTTAGVGAAFDFVAGTVREAPSFMQSAGLEWLFRLGTEPRRLWRRYLVGNISFVLTVAPDVLRRMRRASATSDLKTVPRSRTQ